MLLFVNPKFLRLKIAAQENLEWFIIVWIELANWFSAKGYCGIPYLLKETILRSRIVSLNILDPLYLRRF